MSAKELRTPAKIKYSKLYYIRNKQSILERSAKRYRDKHVEIRQQAKTRYHSDLVGVMHDRIKQRARKMNIPFSLTKEDIIIPSVCPILGIPLERSSLGFAKPNSPSVDKIIPALGYIKGNIQVISYKANCMKSNATPDELIKFSTYFLAHDLRQG